MKFWLKLSVLASLGALTACSSSESVSEPDSGIAIEVDPEGECGNGTLERGEQCDSSDTAVCNADCTWVAYCGNGMMEAGETCDDGNRMSGDGCSADCRSNETCGNDIIDFEAGEICDGTTTCAADCRSVTACGDSTVAADEQCDDGNTTALDGCGMDCRTEIVLPLADFLPSIDQADGCDFTGDGEPDNAIGRGLSILSAIPAPDGGMPAGDAGVALPEGALGFLVSGLDDGAGGMAPTADNSLRLALVAGETDDAGDFQIYDAFTNSTGMANYGFDSRIEGGMLVSAQADIEIPLFEGIMVTLRRATLQGDVGGTSSEPTISAGQMCGIVPLAELDRIVISDLIAQNPDLQLLEAILPEPCVADADPTVADWVAGGVAIPLGNLPSLIGDIRPDVDVDGDGLEAFEITRGDNCQPIITGCFDGGNEANRLERSQCFQPGSGINDGYSGLFTFTTVETVGVAGVIPTPDPTMMPDGGTAMPDSDAGTVASDGGTSDAEDAGAEDDAAASDMDAGT